MKFNEKALDAVEKGHPIGEVTNAKVLENIAKMKYLQEDELEDEVKKINKEIMEAFSK